jgi:hypothetical protein
MVEKGAIQMASTDHDDCRVHASWSSLRLPSWSQTKDSDFCHGIIWRPNWRHADGFCEAHRSHVPSHSDECGACYCDLKLAVNDGLRPVTAPRDRHAQRQKATLQRGQPALLSRGCGWHRAGKFELVSNDKTNDTLTVRAVRDPGQSFDLA